MISTHFAANSILMQNTHWDLILHGIDGKYVSFKVWPQSLVWEEKKIIPRGTKQFHAWECELGKSAMQLFLVQKRIKFRLTKAVNQNTRLVHYRKKIEYVLPFDDDIFPQPTWITLHINRPTSLWIWRHSMQQTYLHLAEPEAILQWQKAFCQKRGDWQ